MKRIRIVWACPKEYVLRNWVFDYKRYGNLTWFVRICGLLIQRYTVITEKVVTHPITGSKHTVFLP